MKTAVIAAPISAVALSAALALVAVHPPSGAAQVQGVRNVIFQPDSCLWPTTAAGVCFEKCTITSSPGDTRRPGVCKPESIYLTCKAQTDGPVPVDVDVGPESRHSTCPHASILNIDRSGQPPRAALPRSAGEAPLLLPSSSAVDAHTCMAFRPKLPRAPHLSPRSSERARPATPAAVVDDDDIADISANWPARRARGRC
ncbi:uncharacterized protein BXZ73DRAFT_101191 [Epithele typhae]|uniref:uncharacterized protein n=1 Tax=Epithele typhae TaxID=378194 RepID=UPI0020089192|nr:uncharacterized protein BXZ73DRAFT_101191 [Epithele typhae]KAH9933232.1 hypothetical protein BXZ73DRAFT_101191 [Epithele typhae]